MVIVGRVQWDPAREMEMSDLDRKCPMPRRSYKRRDIQIGVKGKLNEMYVASVISIQDVTDLAHKLQEAHSQRSEKEVGFVAHFNENLPLSKVKEKVEELEQELPVERMYMPSCSKEKLLELRLVPEES